MPVWCPSSKTSSPAQCGLHFAHGISNLRKRSPAMTHLDFKPQTHFFCQTQLSQASLWCLFFVFFSQTGTSVHLSGRKETAADPYSEAGTLPHRLPGLLKGCGETSAFSLKKKEPSYSQVHTGNSELAVCFVHLLRACL